MEVYSSKEFVHGCRISHPTLKSWIDAGMPVIRNNPYLFNARAVRWIMDNKPEKYEYLVTFLKMVGEK